CFFCISSTAPVPSEIYSLSLHDALPIFPVGLTWNFRLMQETRATRGCRPLIKNRRSTERMAIDTFEIRHQMNDEAAELESLRSEVEEKETTMNELEGVICSLEADCDDLQRENDELIVTVGAVDSDNYALTEAIRDALEDLRTLPEVPLNLVEAAVANIVDDLSAVIRDA